MEEKESIVLLARCWNNLDISLIEDLLADDVVYVSQWVLEPIKGKKAYLTYLASKFNAIRPAVEFKSMTVTAELAFHPLLPKQTLIVLTQKTRDEIRRTSVLIELQSGKISQINMCFIPDPDEAILTGEIPR